MTDSNSPLDWLGAAWMALGEQFDLAQDWLFTQVIQPALAPLGLSAYAADGYLATQWLLLGLIQIALIGLVLVPLERLSPFEADPAHPDQRKQRRQAVGVDVVYTLLDRLGIMRLALFFMVEPLLRGLFGWLSTQGFSPWHLDQAVAPLWPGITDHALFGFCVYMLVLDAAGYAIHRAQHRWEWWWSLHAVHHSQQHMTAWSDSRNHLLDLLLVDTLFALLARIIGVPTDQFVTLIVLSKMMESLSHANLRLGFGWLGERLLVGPRFHRVHHGVDVDAHIPAGKQLHGCNFGVLFPVWDLVGKTARYPADIGPTGIHDQLPENGGRDYGKGFWAQQVLALQRLAASVR
jgi:sterol desaturase/sphingolipid hydroxylase (fatty acid hydroxylase superfamily)